MKKVTKTECAGFAMAITAIIFISSSMLALHINGRFETNIFHALSLPLIFIGCYMVLYSKLILKKLN